MSLRYVLALICLVCAVSEDAVGAKIAPFRFAVKCDNPRAFIPYAATQRVDKPNSRITRIVSLDRFPNLKTVVVVGHSSGGQMAQRYALAGTYAPRNGVAIRYVASAPSSFAYLNEKRPRRGSPVKFETLDAEALKSYPDYNKWGYGLENRYRAFRRGNDDYFRKRYAARRVLYLCGDKDTDMNSSSLSKNYGAMLQGRQRLERMQLFYAHLIDVYGDEIRKTHAMAVAPGVDHNGYRAYASPQGLRFLFDVDRRDSDHDGTSDWDEWLAGTDGY